MAGSATTIIVSTLELPLFKGNKRVFVRDAHLFPVGKYVVIDRWFVSLIVGKGSIIIEDPAPRDFPPETSVRTTGQEDEWSVDENGRMLLTVSLPTSNRDRGQIHPVKRRSSKHLLPLLANSCRWTLRMRVSFILIEFCHWIPHMRILWTFFHVGNQDHHMILIRTFLQRNLL